MQTSDWSDMDLWIGNFITSPTALKISCPHIFSATYQNWRPEEMRPFGISSPKSRKSAMNPKTIESYTSAAGFPQFWRAISRLSEYRTPLVSRQCNCLLGPNIRGWPLERTVWEVGNYACAWLRRWVDSDAIVHCPGFSSTPFVHPVGLPLSILLLSALPGSICLVLCLLGTDLWFWFKYPDIF
jgi:hypothetical protein